MELKTYYDVLKLLKSYGIYVYVGKRLWDIECAEIELRALYQARLLDQKTFQHALLVLRHEHRLEKNREEIGEGS